MSNNDSLCGFVKHEIGSYYKENIHVYITIPICSVGMILNLLNVLVFTRKTMNSPPNLILAHLAFVDFLFLLSNIAESWLTYFQFENDSDRKQSYGWTILYLYSDISLDTFHFISIFLTVQLAVWRYIAVVHPLKERHWCTKKITRNVVITGHVVCTVSFAVAYLLSLDIDARNVDGITYYKVTSKRHPITNSIRFLAYGLVIKIFPSFVLAGLTSRIVVTLLARKNHREQLGPSASTRSNIKNVEMRQQTKRSTTILLAVAALFFMAEFPVGILRLLATINERDWKACYYSLGEMFLTIANINTSVTFMVYYTLSQQFRTTFKSMFSGNPRTSISHQTHPPLVLGDSKETDSGWKSFEV
ncbi:G-protein coupled receptor dmsr-1-like [Planococcus citri]|uniref:G-protein coupled receptor dmsr-1-like n=1 Tax=Planococcus citri TaxID=170843 RepID=UPI0031F9BCA9